MKVEESKFTIREEIKSTIKTRGKGNMTTEHSNLGSESEVITKNTVVWGTHRKD